MPINCDKVFNELPIGAFDDKERARSELVQFLQKEKQPRIRYGIANDKVQLTGEGRGRRKDNRVFRGKLNKPT